MAPGRGACPLCQPDHPNPGPGHHPGMIRGWSSARGYRSKTRGGENPGQSLAPTCAEAVREIYRAECGAFSLWLCNNTLGF